MLGTWEGQWNAWIARIHGVCPDNSVKKPSLNFTIELLECKLFIYILSRPEGSYLPLLIHAFFFAMLLDHSNSSKAQRSLRNSSLQSTEWKPMKINSKRVADTPAPAFGRCCRTGCQACRQRMPGLQDSRELPLPVPHVPPSQGGGAEKQQHSLSCRNSHAQCRRMRVGHLPHDPVTCRGGGGGGSSSSFQLQNG